MRQFRAGVALAGFLLLIVPSIVLLGTQAAHAGPSYNVYVGYADSGHSAPPARFPTPFSGPGITLLGQPESARIDSGAVRIVNASGAAEHVDYVKVDDGGVLVDPWGADPVTIPAGGQAVFDQTAPFNFDTSDYPREACTNDHVIPTVTVSVDGVATTYDDTGQILNTGGIDPANCKTGPAANESTQWVSIGQPPCLAGATLGLAPVSQTAIVGEEASVTATLSACGAPLSGASVTLTVTSGPNSGQILTGTTDTNGNVTFSYTSASTGTDTLEAAVINVEGTLTSNDGTVTWIAPFPPGGAFVVGDLPPGTANGTAVTFWGAKWPKDNSLSGGSAPASFKGFEDSSTLPGCGNTWTTDPGNSAPPPDGPLPSVMAVVVSSSITQTGSTITGNVAKVVLVSVDPGYAPNPGHAGTGTIVGTVCG